jgi:soluble lytic murein transglycosylase-like protein
MRLFFLLAASFWLTSAAFADMWTYTDSQGVKHFASSQIDRRYVLLFKGMSLTEASGQSSATGSQMATTTPLSLRTVSQIQASPGYLAVQHHVHAAAKLHQVDAALVQAVIAAESGFNSNAISPKGAVGLMQVMPATAQRYGVANDRSSSVAKKLVDPVTNINTGTRYLRDLLNLFPGQLELALAAYNAGEGAVQKAGNRIPDFRETQNYVQKVMQLYRGLNPYLPAPL